MDIFWGHHKIGLYSGVISTHFRVFSEGQGTEQAMFFGLLKFQIFFGVFEILKAKGFVFETDTVAGVSLWLDDLYLSVDKVLGASFGAYLPQKNF